MMISSLPNPKHLFHKSEISKMNKLKIKKLKLKQLQNNNKMLELMTQMIVCKIESKNLQNLLKSH